MLQNNDFASGGSFPSSYETDIGHINSQDFSTPTTYGFVALATQTTTSAAIGTNRSSRTMNGYVGGLGQSFIPNVGFPTPYVITNANGLPTDVSLQTDTHTNTIAALFNFANPFFNADISTDVSSGRIGFGGIGYGRTAYIDDQHLVL